MKMNLSMLLTVINGTDKIKVFDLPLHETLYEGTATECPFIDADVCNVYVSNGILRIEVK